jgi:chorismate mutase/prephenate dehydratase
MAPPRRPTTSNMTANQPPRKIEDIRTEIDRIDGELVSLLDQRAALAREIGHAKLIEGRVTFDPSRQKLVLQRAIDAGNGEFPPEALRNVFVEVMSGCISREKPPTVGYLGPEATYSHMAALSEFGNSVMLKPLQTIGDAFVSVDRGWVDYAVVPIENSTGGVIHSTLDMFLDYEVQICSEIYLRIHHNLISRSPIERITTIYSKIEPFQQCQTWLQENLPKAQLIEVGSTAKGVELTKDRDYAAAIGSEIAARRHGLKIIAAHIEDMKDNTTRFLVIGKQYAPRTGRDKTSIMFAIKDEPGALYDLLRPFADQKINLTKLENRPTKRKAWDLVFFLDMEGHLSDAPIASALEILTARAQSVRIMGSYPRDIEIRELPTDPTELERA